MEVRNRKQILFTVFDPCFALRILAFGAMPVAAGVIADANMPALIAFVYMSAQGRCTATQQGTQGALHISVGCMLLLQTLSRTVLLPVPVQRRVSIASYVQPVERAEQVTPVRFGHMKVDHGGFDAFMAQQFFYGDDIHAKLQQMRGITVA